MIIHPVRVWSARLHENQAKSDYVSVQLRVVRMNVETAIRTGAKHLGYEDLKDKQMEAMCSFLNGNAFVSLPTKHCDKRHQCTALACMQLAPSIFSLLREDTGSQHKQQTFFFCQQTTCFISIVQLPALHTIKRTPPDENNSYQEVGSTS